MSLLNNNFIAFDGTPVTGRVPTQLIVYAPDGYELPPQLQGAVSHAYKLFCDVVNTSAIPKGYHVQNRDFSDGSKCRMESNAGVHRVMVWPVVPGEYNPDLYGLFVQQTTQGGPVADESAAMLLTGHGSIKQHRHGRTHKDRQDPAEWGIDGTSWGRYNQFYAKQNLANFCYAHGPKKNGKQTAMKDRIVRGGMCRGDNKHKDGDLPSWVAYTSEGEQVVVHCNLPYIHSTEPITRAMMLSGSHATSAPFHLTFFMTQDEGMDGGTPKTSPTQMEISFGNVGFSGATLEVLDISPDGTRMLLLHVSQSYIDVLGPPVRRLEGIWELTFSFSISGVLGVQGNVSAEQLRTKEQMHIGSSSTVTPWDGTVNMYELKLYDRERTQTGGGDNKSHTDTVRFDITKTTKTKAAYDATGVELANLYNTQALPAAEAWRLAHLTDPMVSLHTELSFANLYGTRFLRTSVGFPSGSCAVFLPSGTKVLSENMVQTLSARYNETTDSFGAYILEVVFIEFEYNMASYTRVDSASDDTDLKGGTWSMIFDEQWSLSTPEPPATPVHTYLGTYSRFDGAAPPVFELNVAHTTWAEGTIELRNGPRIAKARVWINEKATAMKLKTEYTFVNGSIEGATTQYPLNFVTTATNTGTTEASTLTFEQVTEVPTPPVLYAGTFALTSAGVPYINGQQIGVNFNAANMRHHRWSTGSPLLYTDPAFTPWMYPTSILYAADTDYGSGSWGRLYNTNGSIGEVNAPAVRAPDPQRSLSTDYLMDFVDYKSSTVAYTMSFSGLNQSGGTCVGLRNDIELDSVDGYPMSRYVWMSTICPNGLWSTGHVSGSKHSPPVLEYASHLRDISLAWLPHEYRDNASYNPKTGTLASGMLHPVNWLGSFKNASKRRFPTGNLVTETALSSKIEVAPTTLEILVKAPPP